MQPFLENTILWDLILHEPTTGKIRISGRKPDDCLTSLTPRVQILHNEIPKKVETAAQICVDDIEIEDVWLRTPFLPRTTKG